MERTELVTARLLLRPWRLTDVEDAFAYGADPNWGRYLWEVEQPYTRQHAEEFVRMATESPWEQDIFFAVVLGGKAIGGVRLYVLDAERRIAGLGYNIAPDHWGKGLATEAAAAVLDYAFRTLDIKKVQSRADTRNKASIGVMQKLGMTEEVTLRQHHRYRDEDAELVGYSIARADWRPVLKA
jgi:RimJ/RimL family protein N-acetyltransferase